MIFGFLLAGALAVLVPKGLFTRLVGTGRVKSVLWGSMIGAPLPLCSCSALPTALGLRKLGATPGATVAFLVAAPETGVDNSISLTYALTDPIMTVFRPIAGVVTAIAAGLATNFFGVPRREAADPAPGQAAIPHEIGDHVHVHVHADEPRAGADGGQDARLGRRSSPPGASSDLPLSSCSTTLAIGWSLGSSSPRSPPSRYRPSCSRASGAAASPRWS